MSILRYEPYIVEFLRLVLLVVFLSFAGYFIKLFPFISELEFLKSNYTLAEFVEFSVFGIISFLLIEFSFRVERVVAEMISLIPSAGVIHRYIFFIVSAVFLYSGWLNTFVKLVGKEWRWLYQLFFAAFTIVIFILIFLILYREGDKLGRNILNKIREVR